MGELHEPAKWARATIEKTISKTHSNQFEHISMVSHDGSPQDTGKRKIKWHPASLSKPIKVLHSQLAFQETTGKINQGAQHLPQTSSSCVLNTLSVYMFLRISEALLVQVAALVREHRHRSQVPGPVDVVWRAKDGDYVGDGLLTAKSCVFAWISNSRHLVPRSSG